MEDFKLNIKEFKTWIKSLRSGKYTQGKGSLQSDKGYCCLGVACKVLIPEDKLNMFHGHLYGVMPTSQEYAPKWLRDISNDFNLKTNKDLWMLNDCDDFTFDEIADLLELVYIHKVKMLD